MQKFKLEKLRSIKQTVKKKTKIPFRIFENDTFSDRILEHLGIIITSHLKLSNQCQKVEAKAHQLINLIRKKNFYN